MGKTRTTGSLWAPLLLGVCASACRGGAEPGPPPSSGTPDRVTIGAVRWYVDYDAAVEVAREADKALWVHFGENPG